MLLIVRWAKPTIAIMDIAQMAIVIINIAIISTTSNSMFPPPVFFTLPPTLVIGDEANAVSPGPRPPHTPFLACGADEKYQHHEQKRG